ncbi:bifunctional homocysteine S-methyltransferase/methylenetetrahydrofolate reductase [Anaerosacchariphilus polymeriproducens]|uniref:Bifunctional homocysteine S-methyltransferase/methylenetetrahydrofolate reductase n=1 Tax=Anaerosacchariphilus polymeriproducens TaxID=1812858 RepID=A0A371B099_9FIRM|nr:bifunctional homocysteine S-methyltransferase/methylenetetrahydrofolate reductase [Anaerosacchariphilus polymeriproducens]RDU25247.1 bifunctional homocysteine S-methyltransferase/methylenetetrahydrofolate reductase [Anaerosacchariphilus polymeriproducens]
MDIREYLKKNRLITDGSMGTYYESLAGEEDSIVERANANNPVQIKKIHLEYIKSGARLIRTNTFATNSMFFQTEQEIVSNIKAGYSIAKEAVKESGENVFIGADIGPISEEQSREYEETVNEYKLIIDSFLEEGASIFVFETFSELNAIQDVTEYIKEKNPEAFILVQCAFDRSGYTKLGLSLKRMVKILGNMDSVDAYGLNCGVAPTHMFEFFQRVEFPNDKFITALPNASYPVALRGKTVYSDNVSYYVEMLQRIDTLGIDIIGGCCGTTPKHIQLLVQKLKDKQRSKKKINKDLAAGVEVNNKTTIKNEEENHFIKKIRSGEKVFVVELDPPFDQDDRKVVDGARILKEARVDAITLSDSPLARARADATHLAVKLQNEMGIPVIAHMTCRDKNVIGLRSILLGSYINNLRNFLFVTGDPIPRGERDKIKSVYEFNSIKLMEYVKSMNEDLFLNQEISYGGALNYHGVNLDNIAERMKKKMEAGAEYFLTQPIYTKDDMERIQELKVKTNGKIICGIMPLVSYRNASFIKNEMPGINVSDEIMEQYKPEMSKEESEETAIRISVGIAKQLYESADGFYFMTPFNRVYLIRTILEEIRKFNV